MDVEINKVDARVHAVDHGSLMSPRVRNQFVREALAAFEEERAHEARVKAEQGITQGVSHELEGQA